MIDRIGFVPVVEGRDFQGFARCYDARSETGSCAKNQLSITLRHHRDGTLPAQAKRSRPEHQFGKNVPVADATA
jgi:hypothetical protein